MIDGGSTARQPDWSELTERTLAELKTCEPIYRPTNFWDFALTTILRDLDTVGLKGFKTQAYG